MTHKVLPLRPITEALFLGFTVSTQGTVKAARGKVDTCIMVSHSADGD